MLFLIFRHIYKMSQYWMFMLKVADVSNNEVNVCSSNPCEQKAAASDCSECSVSNSFFYFQPEPTSTHDGFLYMVICSTHSAQVHCSAFLKLWHFYIVVVTLSHDSITQHRKVK